MTRFRVLQTTDVHLNLAAYDYFADQPERAAGLLSLSSVIKDARAEVSNSILLDTGDFLQGTPLGDLYAQDHPKGDVLHPAVSVMNAIGYDAGTIGNHEFNFGLDFLTGVVSGAGFPIVLANAALELGAEPLQDQHLFQPYVIVTRQVTDTEGKQHDLRLGLIGFVPPQVCVWERRHLQNRVHVRDIVETARAFVPRIKSEGADIIIALSHSGIASLEQNTCDEHASLQLAEIDGIDVVLCGHQHKRFPGPEFTDIRGVDPQRGTLHGKPAVMPAHWGAELGIVDLDLTHDTAQGWRIVDHHSSLRPAQPDTPSDTSLNALIEQHHKATIAYIRTPIARTRDPMHTYFTYLGFDLATRAIAKAQRLRAAEILGDHDLPLLSAASPFRAGGHAGPSYFTEVQAGPLTIRDLADLYLFPNTLSVLRVSAAQLRDWLERSAGKFKQVQPGKSDQPILCKGFPSYNFDIIQGVDYQIDVSQPSRYSVQGRLIDPNNHRISALLYKGQPVRDDQEFLVATNSYRAGGAGLVPDAGIGQEVLATQEEIRTILMNYFRHHEAADLTPRLNWEFASLPDTSVLFPLSPKARRYLAELPLDITDTGEQQDGFDLYRHAL